MARSRRTLALAGIGIVFAAGGGAAFAASHGSSTPAKAKAQVAKVHHARSSTHHCPHMDGNANMGGATY